MPSAQASRHDLVLGEVVTIRVLRNLAAQDGGRVVVHHLSLAQPPADAEYWSNLLQALTFSSSIQRVRRGSQEHDATRG